MKRYRKVYSFSVLDEIAKGEMVRLVDRSAYNQYEAIRTANNIRVQDLLDIINCKNEDNRYEFYKEVTTNE